VKEFRYPPRVLFGDYLRSAAGLFVGLGVLLAVPPNLPVLIIFGATAVLFAVFGLRTAHRHILRVAVSEDAIACRGIVTRVIPWRDIATVRLRYFGSRRSKWRPLGSGFMQLTLKGAKGGGGRAMTFESTIEGFDRLAGRAAAALKARGLPLDPATASNLIELGIDPEALPEAGWAPPPDGCQPPSNVL
jgi:hypothetical protein